MIHQQFNGTDGLLSAHVSTLIRVTLQHLNIEFNVYQYEHLLDIVFNYPLESDSDALVSIMLQHLRSDNDEFKSVVLNSYDSIIQIPNGKLLKQKFEDILELTMTSGEYEDVIAYCIDETFDVAEELGLDCEALCKKYFFKSRYYKV